MPTIADLVVKLDVQSAKFRAEITKIQNELERVRKHTEEASLSLKEFGEMLHLEIVKEAAMRLFEFAKAGGEVIDRMSRLSEEVGVEIGALSELSYAAQVTQVGTETLATGLVRMSKSMGQAGDNSTTATRAFKALQIDIRDVEHHMRSANDVFREVAERFSEMEDGPVKTAIAVAIFGRGGAELIPMLNKLTEKSAQFAKEAENIGYKLDEKAKAAANDFQESLTRLHLAMESLSMQIAVKLSPFLKELADAIVKSDDTSKAFKFTVDAIVGVFKWVGVGVLGVVGDLEIFRDVMGSIIAAAIQFEGGEFRAAWKTLKQGATDVVDDVEKTKARIEALLHPKNDEDDGKWGSSSLKFAPDFQAESSEAERKTKQAFETLERMVETHQEKMVKLSTGYEFGIVGEMRYRLASGDLAKALAYVGDKADYFRQKILELTEAEAQATAEAERNKQATDAYKSLTTEVNALQQALAKKTGGESELDRMLVKLRSPEVLANLEKLDVATRKVFIDDLQHGAAELDKFNARQKQIAEWDRQDAEAKQEVIELHKFARTALEKYNDQVAHLAKLSEESGLSQADLANGIERAKEEYIKAGGEMTDFTKEMSESMQSSFVDNLFDSFDKGVDQMLMSWVKMLEMMVAKALAADLFSGLLGIGAGGGWGTNALNALGGSIGSGTNRRAGGGPVQMGQTYLVGEHGPETFVPAMSGNIVPNKGTNSAQSGSPQTVRHILEVADHGHRTVREIWEGFLADEAARR